MSGGWSDVDRYTPAVPRFCLHLEATDRRSGRRSDGNQEGDVGSEGETRGLNESKDRGDLGHDQDHQGEDGSASRPGDAPGQPGVVPVGRQLSSPAF